MSNNLDPEIIIDKDEVLAIYLDGELIAVSAKPTVKKIAQAIADKEESEIKVTLSSDVELIIFNENNVELSFFNSDDDEELEVELMTIKSY